VNTILTEGLAYKQIDARLVVLAQNMGIDARLIADECVRQLDEMPSHEIH
jgi:hypothetical protein